MATYSKGSELWQKVQVTVTITDVSNSTTKTLVDVVALKIEMQRSQPMTWQIRLNNANRQYTKSNTSSTYYDWLRPLDNFRWKINITSDTESKDFDYLRALAYESVSDEQGYGAVINGIDYSWKLLEQNKTMETWQSSSATVHTSTSIIAAILTDLSVSYDLDSDSYPIRIMHFQGEIPLDVIKKILKVTWAEWRFDNNVFKTRQPTFSSSGPEDWTIEDYRTIRNLTYKYAPAGAISRVTVQRTGPAAKLAIDVEGVAVGLVECDTAFPCIRPVLQWEAKMGSCVDFVLFDADHLSTGYYPVGPPGGAITHVHFTFQQKTGLTADEAKLLYYHVKMKADAVLDDEDEVWGDQYEEDYNLELTNSTLETELGEQLPAGDPETDSLIPNQTWAQTYGENFLKESARKIEEVSGEIGLHCQMIPAQTLKITEYGSGLDTYFYVENVTHTVEDGKATTSITATKYRSDTIS